MSLFRNWRSPGSVAIYLYQWRLLFGMLIRPVLSSAEFSSLEIAAKGPFPVPSKSIPHSQRLTELKFIAAVFGGFEMTSAGRFRIAVGS
jgi:hypothetical protein